MMESARYLVSQEIAIRSGVADSRYRIADGRFVLNDRDLARIRFSVDEYVNGLEGVEKVSKSDVETLIAKNGYKMGIPDTKETDVDEGNKPIETEIDENANEVLDEVNKEEE